MKFYDCQPAPSPRRVRMFIAEKDIDIPTVEVDLRDQEHLGDAFKAINPRCTVPVLELDDGTCLNESLAICHYLESRFPDPNLLGRDGREQALVINWYQRIVIDGFLAAAEALRNQARGFENRALTGPESYAQIPALVKRGRKRLEAFIAQLDERLAASSYIALDRFTVADIGGFVSVEFAGWIKMPVVETWPNIARWYAEVAQRPSASV